MGTCDSGPAAVPDLLRRHHFRFSSEEELQAGIDQVLVASGITFAREVQLGAAGRIDFLIGAGLGLEVKVGGSPAEVSRQLIGYAESPAIARLLLVTTRRAHVAALAGCPTLLGKGLELLWLSGGAL